MALRRLQKQIQLLRCTRPIGYEVPIGFRTGLNASGAVAHGNGYSIHYPVYESRLLTSGRLDHGRRVTGALKPMETPRAGCMTRDYSVNGTKSPPSSFGEITQPQ